MKTLLSVGLGVVVVSATAAGVPAWQAHQAAAWQAAGDRALAEVRTPAAFEVYRGSLCGTPICLTASSTDPRASVQAVRAGLAAIATGAIRSRCAAVPIPHSPDSCRVDVPVKGSRLRVELFARHSGGGKTVRTWTYSGSIVEIHVADRNG